MTTETKRARSDEGMVWVLDLAAYRSGVADATSVTPADQKNGRTGEALAAREALRTRLAELRAVIASLSSALSAALDGGVFKHPQIREAAEAALARARGEGSTP